MNRNGTILLVEDNQDDIDLTLRAFEKTTLANEIVVVRDGPEAIDYLLARLAPLPEVVLLDIKLPKLSGLEVIQRLRADERTRRLPIVILTSSNEEQDIVLAYRFGANSFVRKPVDFAQFAMAARQLGIYWLFLNVPPPR